MRFLCRAAGLTGVEPPLLYMVQAKSDPNASVWRFSEHTGLGGNPGADLQHAGGNMFSLLNLWRIGVDVCATVLSLLPP